MLYLMLDQIAYLLISPLNSTILGILLGLCLLRVKRLIKWAKALIAVSILWAFLCSQYFFSYWLIAPLENAFEPIVLSDHKWQSADAAWVLACYHFEAEKLPTVSRFNQCSLERLVHAANMYRLKPLPIYLTGGDFNTDSDLNHASEAALFLSQLGVNESDIKIINKGHNTASEATNIITELHTLGAPATLAVVSSATHGLRLSKMLTHANIDFIFVPVHYATKGDIEYRLNIPSLNSLTRSERALYEYAANIKHWLVERNEP